MQYLSATTRIYCKRTPYFIRKDVFLPALAAHCGGEMRSFVGRCQIAIFSSQRMKSLLQQRMPWEALTPRAMSVGQSGNDEVRRQRARPFEVENAPSPYDARFSKKGSCLIQAFQQTRTLITKALIFTPILLYFPKYYYTTYK